jgi:hypothetical protein
MLASGFDVGTWRRGASSCLGLGARRSVGRSEETTDDGTGLDEKPKGLGLGLGLGNLGHFETLIDIKPSSNLNFFVGFGCKRCWKHSSALYMHQKT